jgi:hypothetical protein
MRRLAAVRGLLRALSVGYLACAASFAIGEEFSLDFSNLASLQLNGSAAKIHGSGPISSSIGHLLRLTDGLSQIGSAYVKEPIELGPDTSFATSFRFQLTNPQGFHGSDGPGGDGFALVIQPSANTAVGAIGGALGYDGIDHSVAIEFDTWANLPTEFRGGDPDGNHVGISLNGDPYSVATASVTPRFNDGQIWHVWIDYSADLRLLQIRVSEKEERPANATLSARVNLAKILATDKVYVGFSGTAGGASNVQDISSWIFATKTPPTVELDATEAKDADSKGNLKSKELRPKPPVRIRSTPKAKAAP